MIAKIAKYSLLLGALFAHAALAEAAQYTLTVVLPTQNPGTVNAANGISCTPNCSASFPAGSVVTLYTQPDGDSVFGGWSDADCGGQSSCTVTMNADTIVSATFNGPGGVGSGPTTSGPTTSGPTTSSPTTSSPTSGGATGGGSSGTAIPVGGGTSSGGGSPTLQPRYLDAGHTNLFAYYDTAQNITWLANSTAGAGSAYDDGKFNNDGRMTWYSANAWAAGLSYGGVGGWRLPHMIDVGGPGCRFSMTGGTSCGQNVINTPGTPNASEMDFLSVVVLGNKPAFNSSGGLNPGPWLRNAGPFTIHQDYNVVWYGSPDCGSDQRNCRDDAYWFDLPDAASPSNAWKYLFGEGEQIGDQLNVEYFAWAVHDGDVGYP